MNWIKLNLTEEEGKALMLVIGNGWGDGDFAEYLDDDEKIEVTERAIRKLAEAVGLRPPC